MGDVIKWPRQNRAVQPGPTHENSWCKSRLHNTSSEKRLQIHNHHVVQYYYDILSWCEFDPYCAVALDKVIDEMRHQRGLPR